MPRFRFALIALLASAPLAACQVIPPADPSQGQAAEAPLAAAVHAAPGTRFTAAEAATCTSGGGLVMPRGRMQTEYCLMPTRDAGKACASGSDCTGDCVATETGVAAGQPVGGTCQPDNGPLFGCFARVEGGKSTGTICVD